MLEVHAVTQQGKDSGSLGIWSDEHISPLQKVVQAIHDQGSKVGLQLWHVGRKGSLPQETAVSASGLPHRERATSALSLEEIHNLVLAFRDAAVQASQAGIDVIEFRQTAGIATAAVGLITHGTQAKEILRNGRADLVAVGRELLRNPFWPRQAAEQLGVRIEGPAPYNHFWF
ncbi:putative 12-oxophytodienoate reductase-like protein 1 [Paenibacillus polymyxa]|nr:putative 12-oxophytodienoate reductase-like protein 1 [Paenibacillus polymyxa]